MTSSRSFQVMTLRSNKCLTSTKISSFWRRTRKRYCSTTLKNQCRCIKWSSSHGLRTVLTERQESLSHHTCMRRGCTSPKKRRKRNTSIPQWNKSLLKRWMRSRRKSSWLIMDRDQLLASTWMRKLFDCIHKRAYSGLKLTWRRLYEVEKSGVSLRMGWATY